jgi:dolichol-phosphate mannosyltransferase
MTASSAARDAPRLVSVIVPTFNESGNIVPLVRAVQRALAGYPLEVLIVDDNSPDGTADVAGKAFAGDPTVRVLVRRADASLAKSIRTGLEAARGDVLAVMDSDFNHRPEYLVFMVEALRYYDCVTASRFLYGGRMVPRSRHLLSWLFNVFVRCLTRGQITDNLYGLFAIHADRLRLCNLDAIFHGYGDYFIRLMYQLQRLRLSILQFPAVNGRRLAGAAHGRFLRTFATYFAATGRLVLQGGTLAHVQGNPGLPAVRQPSPEVAPGPWPPRAHGGLPADGRPGRGRRSA